MFERRIEEASLNAWPALQQMLFDGWILRFSKGYTKRANSVNSLFASSLDVHEKIVTCERTYREKGLPTIFRLTPFSSPPDLDRVLESRSYTGIDLTLVLHLDLQRCQLQPLESKQLRDESLVNWMKLFCNLSSSSLGKHQTHREILQTIPSRRYLASLAVDDQAVACGMGVLEAGFFGLFDIVTDPRYRNRGYGAQLVSSMLRWAQEHGAKHAYLQVVANNTAAQRLYEKLGFTEAYQYWYRVPAT
jgi:ribosomal protein S18 acetylase RimI-like enzyme